MVLPKDTHFYCSFANNFVLRSLASFGLIIMLWSVLAVELTLEWNGVSGIYSVNSTSQVIPLVVGIGIIITVIWKLSRKGNSVR